MVCCVHVIRGERDGFGGRCRCC
ncbi:hypothetical protein Gotur_013960 [Gossypium turneri]